jgi:hypothetical protein
MKRWWPRNRKISMDRLNFSSAMIRFHIVSN